MEGDQPSAFEEGLRGFRGIRNDCSVSGGWILMALTGEYIKSRLGFEVLRVLGIDFSDEEQEDRGPWF